MLYSRSSRFFSTTRRQCQWWSVSGPIRDRKSTFVGRAIPVTSIDEAKDEVRNLLETDKKVSNATHNVVACRVSVSGSVLEYTHDDGEPPAGRKILQVMQRSNVVNVAVLVTRWYGGVQIGPDRFKHICQCAFEALKARGYAAHEQKGKAS
jgi:putative IMPACT (imprinted ancient) family translation regulator